MNKWTKLYQCYECRFYFYRNNMRSLVLGSRLSVCSRCEIVTNVELEIRQQKSEHSNGID